MQNSVREEAIDWSLIVPLILTWSVLCLVFYQTGFPPSNNYYGNDKSGHRALLIFTENLYLTVAPYIDPGWWEDLDAPSFIDSLATHLKVMMDLNYETFRDIKYNEVWRMRNPTVSDTQVFAMQIIVGLLIVAFECVWTLISIALLFAPFIFLSAVVATCDQKKRSKRKE